MSELFSLTPNVSQFCHSGRFPQFQSSVKHWKSFICNAANRFTAANPASRAIFSFHPLELF
jgi:hypothetical protein